MELTAVRNSRGRAAVRAAPCHKSGVGVIFAQAPEEQRWVRDGEEVLLQSGDTLRLLHNPTATYDVTLHELAPPLLSSAQPQPHSSVSAPSAPPSSSSASASAVPTSLPQSAGAAATPPDERELDRLVKVRYKHDIDLLN